MYNTHAPESQMNINEITRNVYLNMNSANVTKRNGVFIDCNNGQPFGDNYIQTRYKHIKEQLTSDNVYSNQITTSNICTDNNHDRYLPSSNGKPRQSGGYPVYSEFGSPEFEANLLPLDQSFELMSHVPSILDEWKPNNIVENAEDLTNKSSVVKSKRRPYLMVQNPGNSTNTQSPFLQNALTLPKSPCSPYAQNSLMFEENQHHGAHTDIRLHNDNACSDNIAKRAIAQHMANPISWDQTTPLQGKALTSPLSQIVAQRAPYWNNHNTHERQDQLPHSPRRLPRTVRSPRSPRTPRTPRTPVSDKHFFGSGYEAPAPVSNQHIEELIEIQQQITPRALPVHNGFEELAGDPLTDDGLFDGCCEKELLIDLFKELTDDLKQANAEQGGSSHSGLDDINMDDFAALLSRSSSAVVRQEVVQNANKENISVRTYPQKLPSFSSVFL